MSSHVYRHHRDARQPSLDTTTMRGVGEACRSSCRLKPWASRRACTTSTNAAAMPPRRSGREWVHGGQASRMLTCLGSAYGRRLTTNAFV